MGNFVRFAVTREDTPLANVLTGFRGAVTGAERKLLQYLTTPSDWAAFSYSANWSDYGTGYPTGGYRKDSTGRVWLKGLVKKSTALAYSDIIATLPAGFRPTTAHLFYATHGGQNGACDLRIDSSGAVYLVSGGHAAWVSLDGISFDPAT